MATTHYVLIDNEAYSPSHPKVLALRREQSPKGESPDPEPNQVTKGIRDAKRIRQSSKPIMNKLEQEFVDFLKSRWREELENKIYTQAITFKLANGVRYSPDVVLLPNCYEVKGPHFRDDAIVKLKVAASAYPTLNWCLVWKENGEWREQIILP